MYKLVQNVRVFDDFTTIVESAIRNAGDVVICFDSFIYIYSQAKECTLWILRWTSTRTQKRAVKV